MGRAPCCDKASVKKGPWSPEEDATLKSYIEQHGTGGNWIALPQKIGLKRCGKSCRLRWLNYLRPNIKHGGFSEEEDNIICSLYISIGSRWSVIAAQLPGRTDNDIKNYWNTRLKKKLLGKQRKEHTQSRRASSLKQEVKKENDNFTAPADTANYNPYWPELPAAPAGMAVAYPYQDPHLDDHALTRKLLIKLGGRFSDNDDQLIPNMEGMNLQCPLDISTTQLRLYDNMLSSSPSINSFMDAEGSSMLSHQYSSSNGAGPMSQGPSSFPMELTDMIYSNPNRLEGLLDSYYGVGMMMNECNGNDSAESTSWGDVGGSNSVYPSPLSNCEGYRQELTLQESLLSDAKYMAPH